LLVCEGLVGLRGIAHVDVRRGDIDEGDHPDFPPPWFSRALELYIQGKGGELAAVEYPTKRVRARAKYYGHRPKKVTVTDKKWWEPRYDWLAFARRNGTLEEGSGPDFDSGEALQRPFLLK